jgi:hypothetical protein
MLQINKENIAPRRAMETPYRRALDSIWNIYAIRGHKRRSIAPTQGRDADAIALPRHRDEVST